MLEHCTLRDMQYILLFHGKNGFPNAPQCYVIRTLSVLLEKSVDKLRKKKTHRLASHANITHRCELTLKSHPGATVDSVPECVRMHVQTPYKMALPYSETGTRKSTWQGGLCMAHHQYQNPPLDTIFCKLYPRNEILQKFILPSRPLQISTTKFYVHLFLLDASYTHYSSSLCNCLFISHLWDPNTVQIPT